ncbi:exonuclease subunit SbcD [Thalassotalea profundi]|uniref:Nuclease SbcCD subunit D n=1 Tax=Thalassotalea profundi TaxID=2036687 RepID=A0ABQ3IQQ4_9GAMM|nr:exonuclease subunit SbcD [Thalassotalea profundi]GHE91030.1 nuclease SbcCD subunit D [Thalassotalea profundi]
MTFRVLHTSDWHLGQYFYGKSRAKEHQAFINWLIEKVSELKINAVIVAGDIFDTGTPPSYARELYFDFIVKLQQLNCQLVLLAGNHDSVAMLNEAKHLLSQMSCTVIASASSITSDQIVELKDNKGHLGAIVCAVPFIRPRDIITSQSGQSASEKQESLQQAIAAHYKKLFKEAKLKADGNVPIIATGHLTTVGVSTSDSVRDIYIGTLEAFNANAFPPADYIALGHIHKSQKVAKSKHIRYCGSPIPLSFDEAKQEKCVLIAEFEQAVLTQVTELTIPRFQPLLMVKTSIDDLAEQIGSVVSNTPLENKEQCIWLDIEINSAEYLQDLTVRIEDIIKSLPVEVLLVRRAKASREKMVSHEKKITLNELSLTDVFETRLAEEHWQTQEEVARKERLQTLFAQVVEQVQRPIELDELSDGDKV